jgi:hypothetical protein
VFYTIWGLLEIASIPLAKWSAPWGLGALAAWSWHASEPTGAIVRISFRHVSGFAGAVERRSAEELERLPAHMRPLDAGRPATARRSEARLTMTAADRAVCVSARDAGWAGDGYDVGHMSRADKRILMRLSSASHGRWVSSGVSGTAGTGPLEGGTV